MCTSHGQTKATPTLGSANISRRLCHCISMLSTHEGIIKHSAGISGPGSALMSPETDAETQTGRGESLKSSWLYSLLRGEGRHLSASRAAQGFSFALSLLFALLTCHHDAQRYHTKQLMLVFALPRCSAACVNNACQARSCT